MLRYGRACAEAARTAVLEEAARQGLIRKWAGIRAVDISNLNQAVAVAIGKLERSFDLPVAPTATATLPEGL
jgi:hypothetical protein